MIVIIIIKLTTKNKTPWVHVPTLHVFCKLRIFLRYNQVAVCSLEAIRRIFGVGELSYILLQTELLMCIMIGLQ